MTKSLGVDTSLNAVSPDTTLADISTPWDGLGNPSLLAAQSNAGSFGVGTLQSDSAPEGLPVTDAKASAARTLAINEAKKYLGTMYHWGGADPSKGFDCSGITQWSLGKAGIRLPRVSYMQANFGERRSIDELQPGDLVAWDINDRNNGADHIALYLGNGMILEAPHTGAAVRIRKIWGHPWGVHIKYPGE